jgi:hypothetical protein
MLLGARLMLPDHVGSPGTGRIAVGAGVEGLAPAVDVRWGVIDALALTFEGVWHPDAPRIGLQARGAAGRSRGTLFASAWGEGHLRPALTTDISESLAGADVAAGLGLVVVQGAFSVALEGGLALGFPVATEGLGRLDATWIDQQGGLFGLQRGTIAVDLGGHVELAFLASFALPIDSVTFRRRGEDVIGQWDVRLGGRLVTRF